jgi:hypothetical protein
MNEDALAREIGDFVERVRVATEQMGPEIQAVMARSRATFDQLLASFRAAGLNEVQAGALLAITIEHLPPYNRMPTQFYCALLSEVLR